MAIKYFLLVLVSIFSTLQSFAARPLPQTPLWNAADTNSSDALIFVNTAQANLAHRLYLWDLINLPPISAPSFVTGKPLTGFSANAGTVTSSDSVLQAFNKVVGNINAISAASVTVGTIDSQTPSANGASILLNNLYMQSASATVPGLVNNSAQTFSGAKTFTGGITGTITGTASGNELPLTFSAPLARATNTISIPAATGSVNGYLPSSKFAEWQGTTNDVNNATDASTAGQLVRRDGSGDFSANEITADLIGNADTATELASAPDQCAGGQFAQGIDANGDANCATVDGLPSQASHAGEYLTTNGTVASWAAVPGGLAYSDFSATSPLVYNNAGGFSMPAATNAVNGYLTATDHLDFVNKQPGDTDLTALAGLSVNGLIVKSGAGVATTRTLTAGSSKVSVTNGDGVSGNPTVDVVPDNILPLSTKGDLLVHNGTTNVRRPVCAANEGLVADSSQASGWRCQVASLQLGGAFIGGIVFPSTASCDWSRSTTSISWGDFPVDSDCPTPTGSNLMGAGLAPATKKPSLAIANLAPGNYMAVVNGWITNPSGRPCHWRVSDGTDASPNYTSGTNSVNNSSNSFYLNRTSSGAAEITIQSTGDGALGNSGTCSISPDSAGRNLSIMLYRMPSTAVQSVDLYEAGNYSPVAYTPAITNFGTVSNVNCTHSREDSFLSVDCTFTSGTLASSEAQVPLPAGLTSVSTLPTLSLAGKWVMNDVAGQDGVVLIEPNKTYFTFGRQTGSLPGLQKRDGSALGAANGSIFSFKARIPVSDANGPWKTFPISAGGFTGDSQVFVSGWLGRGSTNTAVAQFQTLNKSAGTDITYATSASLGDSFTINRSGIYSMIFTAYRSGAGFQTGISVNSSLLSTDPYTPITYAQGMRKIGRCNSSGVTCEVSFTSYLNAGDVVRLQVGTTDVLVADFSTTFVVTRVN